MAADRHFSLLDVFLDVAHNAETSQRNILECGLDTWTYSDLDIISSALAQDLSTTLGCSPRVAVVSENHPYVFALMLAVWKLGGIFIPIDVHVPAELLTGMLRIVAPDCVVIPETDLSNQRVISALYLHVIPFNVNASTMSTLRQKYVLSTQKPLLSEFPLPHVDRACLYLFTSSASSTANLKCVPLTHALILSNCRSKLAWWRRVRPEENMDGMRVLGWAPWSHILAYMQDIGTATLLNAGCYVFASVPSTYPTQHVANGLQDPTSNIIKSLLNRRITAFACVPFILSELKAMCDPASGPDAKDQMCLGAGEKVRLISTLQNLIMFECGGAALEADITDWTVENGISVMVGIGMTETAGTVLAARAQDARSNGYSAEEALIADGILSLVGPDEEEMAFDGELVVKSKLIPHGYIKYHDSAFSVDSDDWVTFKTGDKYQRTPDGHFKWLGRKTDFIQMTSSETLDPRPIEKALCMNPIIANACVIGDRFLREPATGVCAIVEIRSDVDMASAEVDREIANVLAPINRDLPPALRIAWSRVLIIRPPQKIPLTKKGEVFRKKIEDIFGTFLGVGVTTKVEVDHESKEDDTEHIVRQVVSNLLGVHDPELLSTLSFAELGMTSFMAVSIVNTLNKHIGGLALPLNSCYIHIDLDSLVDAISLERGHRKNPTPFSSNPFLAFESSQQKDMEIVIVGKAFRLPGSLDNSTSLWEALLSKSDSVIGDIPPDRWDHASFYPHDICFTKAGLVDVSHYDYRFFGLTATEALYVSPTMRLALEVSFEALENANIPLSKLKGTRTAVYVATKDDGFETLLNAEQGYDAYTRFYGTGRAPSTASGRISYLLDIHGPSVTVDTACSGGIVCIDQAITFLQSGGADTAIVCSSNTHCWPGSFMFLTAQGMVSPNGRCATFTTNADGYVPSEGAVAFVLKTHSAATRDKDNILAVIKSTDVSHNGRSQGLVAPNVKAQTNLHQSLLRKAGLHPDLINFIEAHGTGTSLGDLSEIQGINNAYTSSRPRPAGPLIISASKTVLGHSEPTAGMAGILTTLLAFEKETVPGLNHLTEHNLNPSLDCSAVPLLIPHEPVHISGAKPHRAAVLSYGFAGTLAGTILESPPCDLTRPLSNDIQEHPMIFVVSGKTVPSLEAYLERYLVFLRVAKPSEFHDICYTTCIGRELYKYRFSCVARNMADLISQIEHRLTTCSTSKEKPRGSLGFVFSGQGTQFPGMAAALAERYSGFRALVSKFGQIAQEQSGYPIDRLLLEVTDTLPEANSEVDQICIFVYQYSVLQWLQRLGIQPKTVLGHSLGEITASVAVGAFSFRSALDLVVTRARLLRPQPKFSAGMAAVAASKEEVEGLIDMLKLAESLSVAVHNSPRSIVVSGASAAVDAMVVAAKKQGLKASRLKVDQAFHSPYVDSAVSGLLDWSNKHRSTFLPLNIPLYSTLTGARIPKGGKFCWDHWVNHARKPVQFAAAAAAMDEDQSIGVLVDVGPQPVAWTLLQANNLLNTSSIALSAKIGKDQEMALLSALSYLVQEHNLSLSFYELYSQRHGTLKKTDVPTYPFRRVHRYPTFIPSRNRSPADMRVAIPPTDLSVRKNVDATPQSRRAGLIACLKVILELTPGEEFDLSETLNARGVDSVMFAQLRKRVGEEFDLDIPMIYLSDVFTMEQMIDYLVEQSSPTSKLVEISVNQSLDGEGLRTGLVSCLRDVLEISSDEELDFSETLNARGTDSIMFAQLRKRVGEGFGLEIPMIYLSDVFTMEDMINFLVSERSC
ncbi:ketoacyl-synt-domain-containing protein [Guyanagaster necrorhizus]|uniref:Ketoacyl-synt-domain-containing protein n=2 Tax=Guyanagaster necrorhizus TaxID=856835 RepID=A0A9P7VYD5_9AGAR